MASERPKLILRKLREAFVLPKQTLSRKDPFEILIATIISQNTASRNSKKAFEKLSNMFKITPDTLANVSESQIEECLKTAGLYRKKAKTIQAVSKTILEEHSGSLQQILSLPLEEARQTLQKLPGVGSKTADVVLLFADGKPTIPVDTHVNRVSKRLGLVQHTADYEGVRTALQRLFEDSLATHLLLISLGRKYCKARNPLCRQCPVNTLCPSNKL
ncbi:MAG: endonuclease III [Candidatus Bathyarchaeota archaeon]|nr:endonuclease III [Candidatus Bathyarchaeota archaeon]